jgi:hypothetical protein
VLLTKTLRVLVACSLRDEPGLPCDDHTLAAVYKAIHPQRRHGANARPSSNGAIPVGQRTACMSGLPDEVLRRLVPQPQPQTDPNLNHCPSHQVPCLDPMSIALATCASTSLKARL